MYLLEIEPRALEEIQQAIDYYDEQQPGLGLKFLTALEKEFSILIDKPKFQIRYATVRCLKIKRYPFMVHFSIENEIVRVHAVLHTSLNPKNYWIKNKK